MEILIVIGTIIISYICLFTLAVSYERKRWNNGICPKCGSKLINFGTDHTGAEGWKCENKKCDHVVWISYFNLVYKKKHEK